MRDLTNAKAIYAKAALFLLIGGLCVAALMLQSPTFKTAALLAMAIWSFCRAYYFAFYVIEKYVDPGSRFSGLWSFGRYLLTRKELKSDTSANNKSINATTSPR